MKMKTIVCPKCGNECFKIYANASNVFSARCPNCYAFVIHDNVKHTTHLGIQPKRKVSSGCRFY